jgi:hypothetical protein
MADLGQKMSEIWTKGMQENVKHKIKYSGMGL